MYWISTVEILWDSWPGLIFCALVVAGLAVMGYSRLMDGLRNGTLASSLWGGTKDLFGVACILFGEVIVGHSRCAQAFEKHKYATEEVSFGNMSLGHLMLCLVENQGIGLVKERKRADALSMLDAAIING